MKSKHDKSNGDKYDSKNGGGGGGDEMDSRSEDGDDRSRSTSRNDRNKSKNTSGSSSSDKLDHDALSIYIGNVDYSATEEELRNTFIGCGDIVRVTIIKNMKTGHPKGAAFIEFTDKDGVHAAMTLNGKQVKGRPLIVTSKKPRPENRKREPRPHYQYDRRPPPRSVAPMYSVYQPPGRPAYTGSVSRGGYYQGVSSHMDNRRGGPIPMQMDPPHVQPRYDPYRRPEFYDPYMVPRGAAAPMPPQQYYHHSAKMGPSGGSNPGGHHHSKSNNQPPVRYSNPYNRR